MMLSTFILFFAFVINTGMLVNAKINLQNAADMAAYAGAAVQARQLNQISFLNYEMRRQFKKFLFRYYVVGNMAQNSHPKNGPEGGPRNWSPDGSPQGGGQIDYKVPAVCLAFNPNDNFCKVSKLSKISIPPRTLLDNVNETLRNFLIQNETARQDNCKFIGKVNTRILFLWLYNTDPNSDILVAQAAAAGGDESKIIRTIRATVQGLGLIPREFILRRRIDTMSYYVNFPPQTGVTLDVADGLGSTPDPSAKERVLQAFYSAYYSLGTHTFDDVGSIKLDELLPVEGSDRANLLKLEDVNPGFDTYAVNYCIQPANSTVCDINIQPDAKQGGRDCVGLLQPISVKPKSVPFGVAKDPKILTYYAVRLRAKANVMFSPFGPIQLTAYSAAQPFGSRIGPRVKEAPFSTNAEAGADAHIPPINSIIGAIPNLPVGNERNDQADGRGKGWDNNNVIGGMFRMFRPPGQEADTDQIENIDLAAFDRAFHAAQIPNPWERGKYNIINDLTADPMITYFDPNVQGALKGIYAFWAPVRSPDLPAQDPKKEIEDLLQNVDMPLGITSLKDGLIAGILQYLQTLRDGQGDDQESFNIVHLPDPFHYKGDVGTAANKLLAVPGKDIVMNNADDVRTSWVETKDSSQLQFGRVGYSVKFISFKSLFNREISTDSVETVSNLFDPDGDAATDIPKIQH